MIVKYLFSFILSIDLSIINVLAISPSTEQSPVVRSNTINETTTITQSTTNNAPEIFIVEYFLMIIATISVPPPEAFSKNSSAAANAGKMIAKQSSSIIFPVSALSIGKAFSNTFRSKEETTVT